MPRRERKAAFDNSIIRAHGIIGVPVRFPPRIGSLRARTQVANCDYEQYSNDSGNSFHKVLVASDYWIGAIIGRNVGLSVNRLWLFLVNNIVSCFYVNGNFCKYLITENFSGALMSSLIV
jgi:hypothetical protein